MSVLCIIPARGGSKRVPGKNLLPLAGRPALAWSLIHARESELVDDVVVSTDDAEIAPQHLVATWIAAVHVLPPSSVVSLKANLLRTRVRLSCARCGACRSAPGAGL